MTGRNDFSSRVPLTLSSDAEHSLRNHLAIIIGFSEVLMREMSIADDVLGDIAEIHDAANAALLILNDANGTSPA